MEFYSTEYKDRPKLIYKKKKKNAEWTDDKNAKNPEHFTHLNKVDILLMRLRQIYLNRTDHNNIFLIEYTYNIHRKHSAKQCKGTK